MFTAELPVILLPSWFTTTLLSFIPVSVTSFKFQTEDPYKINPDQQSPRYIGVLAYRHLQPLLTM